MKVAVVTDFPRDPGRPRGGVQAVSVNLVRALAAFDDLELDVVTTAPDAEAPSRSQWAGVTVHRLPRLGRRMLTGSLGPGRRQVCAYLDALAPDVVHAHDVYGLMVMGLPLPRVLTIHGFIYGDTQVSGERFAWLRAQVWRRVEAAAWAAYPHIISISPYVRERLTGIASGVIHDIDNPVAEDFFRIARRERKGTVFTAALIEPRKNTMALVEAIERLVRLGGDVHLRIAGAASDLVYLRRVEEFVAARGLGDRVTLLGRLGMAEIARELEAASVFALVSLEENSPLAIEEAMAAGVPVLTSNRCGMPYMIRHGESGFLVDPLDAQDIADRLGELLQDDARRSAMGSEARRVATDRFAPDSVARRTRDVYLRALRDRTRAKGRSGGG